MVDLVVWIRAGLIDFEWSFVIYFFMGFTGIGKMQMVKVFVGFLYGDELCLVWVDMGEMIGSEFVACLIGDCYDSCGFLIDVVCQ